MTNLAAAATFAASAVAFYAAHHAGDYWVQSDHQAATKGKEGGEGRVQCLLHVLSYTLTQAVFLMITAAVVDLDITYWGAGLALLVSGGTHYLADRREFGLMFPLARLIPGKANFLKLGVPRARTIVVPVGSTWETEEVPLDNPSLGTGGWALDQAWHIVLGVWVPALILAAFA